MWFIPYTKDNIPNVNSYGYDIGILDQIPGARWKLMNKWSMGGQATTLKGYISTKKMRGGPDPAVADSWLGGITTGGWTDPTELMRFYFGWARADFDPNPLGPGRLFASILQVTYYVEFSEPSKSGMH